MRRNLFCHFACIAVILCQFAALSSLCEAAPTGDIKAQTINHADGNRTLSQYDYAKGELQEVVIDKRDVRITRKIFKIDTIGRVISGRIYDGKNNLLANVLFGYDQMGRIMEERMINTMNQIVKRTLYPYDAQGRKGTPIIYHYNPRQPGNSPRRTTDANATSVVDTPNATVSREERIKAQQALESQRSGGPSEIQKTRIR